MTELSIIIYILVALAVAIFLRLTAFDDHDDYGELMLACLSSLFWVVSVPVFVYLYVVDRSSQAIQEFRK